jgi:hypothetical protein
METGKDNSRNPTDHTARLKEEFKSISQHLREDVKKVDDLQAKALFEVSAEVIDGLHKAFSDYEQKNEKGWIK